MIVTWPSLAVSARTVATVANITVRLAIATRVYFGVLVIVMKHLASGLEYLDDNASRHAASTLQLNA